MAETYCQVIINLCDGHDECEHKVKLHSPNDYDKLNVCKLSKPDCEEKTCRNGIVFWK